MIIPSSSLNFCDNFSTYAGNLSINSPGAPIAENSPRWNTWSELINGSSAPFLDDCEVSGTEYYSFPNSLYFNDQTGNGGPQDIVLMFDNTPNITQSNLSNLITPLHSGVFTYSHMMKVNVGKSAYFNFQADNVPGSRWADIFLDSSGTLSISNNYGNFFTDSYPINQWFELKFIINLSTNDWEVYIDNSLLSNFSNQINQISSLNLYANTNNEFWIDDVCFSHQIFSLDTLNAKIESMDPLQSRIEGELFSPAFLVKNIGIDTITSLEFRYTYDNTITTETFLTNNINSLGSQKIYSSKSFELKGGSNPFNIEIININGNYSSYDTITINLDGIIPAEGKLVIGELAVGGTWNSWAPRGYVNMNLMQSKYKNYWQGINIHNSDILTDSSYSSGINNLVSGYPSGLVDRGSVIDPSLFELDFLQKIILPPNALLYNEAEKINDTLKVSVNLKFKNQVSNNWKLICLLVEDSIKGIGNDYYQQQMHVVIHQQL